MDSTKALPDTGVKYRASREANYDIPATPAERLYVWIGALLFCCTFWTVLIGTALFILDRCFP